MIRSRLWERELADFAGRSWLTGYAAASKHRWSFDLCGSRGFHAFPKHLRGYVARCSDGSWGIVMSESPSAMLLDTELLRRVGNGCLESFAVFYDRYSALLFSIAANVLQDVQEAEEVLQDAARLVWEKAPGYDPGLGKPVSWAVVITRNKAIDRLRVLRRRRAALSELTAEADFDSANKREDALGDVLAREANGQLRVALGELPVEQREAIELAFFAGLSQTEVALRLNLPLGTIKARIRRGMLTMRDVLEGEI